MSSVTSPSSVVCGICEFQARFFRAYFFRAMSSGDNVGRDLVLDEGDTVAQL
jgi:hypothetical protein